MPDPLAPQVFQANVTVHAQPRAVRIPGGGFTTPALTPIPGQRVYVVLSVQSSLGVNRTLYGTGSSDGLGTVTINMPCGLMIEGWQVVTGYATTVRPRPGVAQQANPLQPPPFTGGNLSPQSVGTTFGVNFSEIIITP